MSRDHVSNYVRESKKKGLGRKVIGRRTSLCASKMRVEYTQIVIFPRHRGERVRCWLE